jgi:beta-barrel assembly-enhancing protease
MHRFSGLLLAGALVIGAVSPVSADDRTQQEAQIGRQVYAELAKKGEIIHQSPDYAILDPIAQQIKRVADGQYDFAFHFILVHEKQPNAFAVPGGNVYVTDALMKFVNKREELAGVLCHETSHDIHHDVLNNMAKDRRAQTTAIIGAIAAELIFGSRAANVVGPLANIGLTAVTQGYSREVESAADRKGAQTCAQAGSNPWGLVWLFEQFEKADTGGHMEMLSDHPTDQHRIDDLQRLFAGDPALYGRFSSNIASAAPLRRRPANEAAR